MSDARLRSLRMVGFKSFAERTVVEFGPGISAVVGPNGSGKSNLADALRWALGEQGRSLRTRRSEDVIFAGSSSRRAVGMADVALVIDNGDRLLPVDYGEVELGRRLFRSGENEYLLNRQRIRLRDLVDLLDAANLADNAFLFIGQGMVDQALALRPEERRPLFEEAAGIRRHERRRRHAEAELAEAESNLERARDLLAELRPQARRLAAQAEQQAARRSAGAELASALVAAARARLLAALDTAESPRGALARAHADADAALSDLHAAEETAARVSRSLAERADRERGARAHLDAARARTVELRLLEGRLATELASVGRDRARVASERDAATRRMAEARRILAMPLAWVGAAADDELAQLEAALGDATRRLAELRDAGRADGERDAILRREREARAAEAERVGRRAREAAELADDVRRRVAETTERAASTEAERASAAADAQAAAAREAAAEMARDDARSELDRAVATFRERAAALDAATAERERIRSALQSAEARLAPSDDDRLLRSARARGGQRVSDGLEVDPALRVAVEAALRESLTAIAVDAAAVGPLAAVGSGTLVVRDAPRPRPADAPRAERAIQDAGGGRLGAAIRRDPTGAVALMLNRVFWVPDVAAAMTVRPLLPAGWRVVTRDGVVVSDDGVVHVGRRGSRLERQAQRTELVRAMEERAPELEGAAAAAEEARRALEAAEARARATRQELDDARRARRVADDRERALERAAEAAAREDAWARSRLATADEQAAVAADAAASMRSEPSGAEGEGRGAPAAGGGAPAAHREGPGAPVASSADPGHARDLADLETGIGALRERRERLMAAAAAAEREREAAREEHRRAEVALSMDEARLTQLDDEAARLVAAESDAQRAREQVSTDLAAAVAQEDQRSAVLEDALRGSGDERERLLEAERSAVDARERLRATEIRIRAAEVAEMEARLHADGVREQLLVELAGIGPEGLAALLAETDGEAPAEAVAEEDLAGGLEQALADAVEAWHGHASGPAPEGAPAVAVGEPVAELPGPPSAARLGALRRRYHELGASNPFAAEEYAEVSARLETMEAQRADLESAIRSTRELIGELNALISGQFRQTFAALEDAFGRRFRQLFDGGEAQLLLTDPDDLSTTGVDITARPPGKKRQPLAMLSGGERALTAVALLMAMLEVRPVPFCVLDEVDAALDEANIDRFSTALRGLAETIQFVVITHNRGTIEAADALYGVTGGDDAVSRVVSLRLDDVAIEGHRAVAVPVVAGDGERVAGSTA